MANENGKKQGSLSFLVCLALLLGLLGVLFARSFQSEMVLFNNDGPLGMLASECSSIPGVFKGFWVDISFLGLEIPTAPPNISSSLVLLMGAAPVAIAKFYAPLCLLFLGLSAWYFGRVLGFKPASQIILAVAAMLNVNTFSAVCWGQPTRATSMGTAFLAVAALYSMPKGKAWAKALLAGMAIGFGIMEGYDVGALYSLLIGSFGVFMAFQNGGAWGRNLAKSFGYTVLTIAMAAAVASHVLLSLVNTSVIGVTASATDPQSAQQRWDFTTQWSLPKLEVLRVAVPGLFGYRMVDEGSRLYPASYWGKVGQQPGFEQAGQGFARHSGSGEYAGLLVLLVAFWVVVQSFRRKHNPLTPVLQRFVWFWAGAAVICLLLSFGRHAPLYHLFYSLPYVNAIRNPIKFMHLFHLCLLILFAVGLNEIFSAVANSAEQSKISISDRVKKWWARLPGYDSMIFLSYGLLFLVSVVGWMGYVASRESLVSYLQRVGFPEAQQAQQMASFSSGEVFAFLCFLLISIIVLILVVSGFFSGRRMHVGTVLIGLVLAVDLSRANVPWIIYYDYQSKYSSNPVIDVLRAKPYENRVSGMALNSVGGGGQLQQTFATLYYQEWLQHLFPFYNVQTVDYAQMPRMSEDYAALKNTFSSMSTMVRYWQLTNTRYLLGLTGFVDALNAQLDPVERRFKVAAAFDLAPKPGIEQPTKLEELTVVLKTNGAMSLIEFTGALPRAGIFSNWRVVTNQAETLKLLSDPGFDLAKTVLLESDPGISSAEGVKDRIVAPAEYVSYSPKEFKLRARVEVPSVLVVLDKFSPGWSVTVNGQKGKIIRANTIVRGVPLPTGIHEVVFRFEPVVKSLRVSLFFITVGFVIIGFLLFGTFKKRRASDGKTD
jgi:hypothetical protein